ncbi:MAG: hypothetical protein SGBAC_003926 [Bacillariaceae sp.]
MWHFERILDGPNRDSFHHPFFLRGNKQLCVHMSRDAKSLPAGTPLRKLSPVEQEISVLQSSQSLQSMLNTIYQSKANTLEKAPVVDRRTRVNSRSSLIAAQGLASIETRNPLDFDQASFAGRSFFPLEIAPKQPTLESSVPSQTEPLPVLVDSLKTQPEAPIGSLERYLDNIISMEKMK